ncbi:hypothetical protein HDU80_003831, partial [Chytriomyces hyalinus]
MLVLLSSESDNYDCTDDGSALELQQEVFSLKETVATLNTTVTNQEREIERLTSIIKRQHEDDKVYYKAFKEGLSLVEADRFKIEYRTNAPTATGSSGIPMSTRTVPPMSAVEGGTAEAWDGGGS